MSDLYRLTYYSNSKIIGDTAETDSEISNILKKSRKNNSESQITGALLYNRDCFAQILEGPYEEIERTFERIQRDERHNNVVPLEFSSAPERGFSIWSMAYVSRSIAPQSHEEEHDLDPTKLTSNQIFKSLHDLVLAQEQG